MKSETENWPKISIVTPSFNQADFLEETITSVLEQGYQNLEYIIIDGGSTDRSVEIIKKYQKHLSFWCSEPDEGQYHAVMKGFEHSTGEIMAWINSDDLYCPWSFKTVGSIFAHFPECRWLTTLNSFYWSIDGYCANIRSVGGYSAHSFADGENAKFRSLRSGFIQQESTFWRRDLWNEVGGIDLTFKLAGDFDLWARFFEVASLYGTYSPLAGFRMHQANRSLDHEAYLEEVDASLMRFRAKNSKYVNNPRKFLRIIFNKIPVARRLLKVYSASNIYRLAGAEGDRWEIRQVNF